MDMTVNQSANPINTRMLLPISSEKYCMALIKRMTPQTCTATSKILVTKYLSGHNGDVKQGDSMLVDTAALQLHDWRV